MSRRSRGLEQEEEEETTTRSSGSDAGEAKQGAGDYEAAIKERQEELKGITELQQKEAEGKKLDDEDKEKLKNTVDEKARINNAIVQLRSEASRKGLALTV